MLARKKTVEENNVTYFHPGFECWFLLLLVMSLSFYPAMGLSLLLVHKWCVLLTAEKIILYFTWP